MRIDKVANSVQSILVAEFPIGAVTLGATRIRFTAEFTSPVNTRLSVFNDAVMVKQFDDGVTFFQHGLPGIFHRQSAAGTFLEYKALRCGVLSKAGP